MNPTRAAIAAATATLSRAAIFDDRITADEHRILAWAQAIAPFSFDQPDLLAAVTAHYQQAEPRTMMPGDAIAGARKIRGERAEREKGCDLAALAPPDPQMGGLPIGGADGTPVWPAYEQHDAISRPCPACGAQPEEACINSTTGVARKLPCMARITSKLLGGVA